MYLRSTPRVKDGKTHRYFSIVESRRLRSGRVAQRQVLYLGEIDDSQQAAWRKTLEVFDEAGRCFTTMSLFPDDREVPVEALDSVQVKLSQMQLRRPRAFGGRKRSALSLPGPAAGAQGGSVRAFAAALAESVCGAVRRAVV